MSLTINSSIRDLLNSGIFSIKREMALIKKIDKLNFDKKDVENRKRKLSVRKKKRKSPKFKKSKLVFIEELYVTKFFDPTYDSNFDYYNYVRISPYMC